MIDFGKMFHLGITKEQLKGATLAIVPGDPARSDRIAADYLENSVNLCSSREYHLNLGYLDGVPVVVCSTGIGGPSTSIAVEELAQCGITTFLRIGTTGAIQPNIEVGSLLITNASVRLDGASHHFAPASYPAVSDYYTTTALVNACTKFDVDFNIGITASSDTFYPGQERYDTLSGYVEKSLQGSCQQWQKLGVLNYEMESSTLFTMCSALGLKAACIAGVIVNRTLNEIPAADPVALEEKGIKVVIEAAHALTRS